jgi:hypothetical protein
MKLDFWTRAVPTLIAILIGNNRLEGTNVGNKLRASRIQLFDNPCIFSTRTSAPR